jgi:hypothetical protein
LRKVTFSLTWLVNRCMQQSHWSPGTSRTHWAKLSTMVMMASSQTHTVSVDWPQMCTSYQATAQLHYINIRTSTQGEEDHT